MSNAPNNLNETFNYKLFFELSADVFCIAGYDGYFKKINTALPALLGYSQEELLSTPINQFIHPADQPATTNHRNELIGGKPLLNFENRYITKKGAIVWLSWTSMPVEEMQLVYAIAKNITDKKIIEEERLQVIENLTKINNDLKLLTYTTSHDLRSPVNNLLAVFNLIDTTKIQDEETLDFFKILQAASQNLKNTLNNYTDILNEKETVKVQTNILHFDDCLQHVIESLGTIIKSSGAIINYEFSLAPTVRFNKGYLESIFLNLITNSIKYASPGSLPIMHLTTKEHDQGVQLVFSDEGLGFDMEQVKGKIFAFGEKFHSHTDSKGIGLYLVYHHITSLGGNISVESKLNEGTTFTITFKK